MPVFLDRDRLTDRDGDIYRIKLLPPDITLAEPPESPVAAAYLCNLAYLVCLQL